jgi:2'-5' RNA ligase
VKEGPTQRLFVAAEVTDAVRSACASLCTAFGSSIKGSRWARSEGVHLTLKFLGSVPQDRLALIADILRNCAAASPRFTLTTGVPGVFGGSTRPRVLWVSLEGDTSQAGTLAGHLEDAFAQIGFEKESRPFRLHLTLARFDPRARTRLPEDLLAAVSREMAGLRIPVEAIVLFMSRPMTGASSYTPLQRFPLLGAFPA